MKKIFTLFVICILMSCNFNGTFRNRESDKKEAELITANFYENMINNQENEAIKLFGKKFFEFMNRNQLDEMLTSIKTQDGNIIGFNLIKWDTYIVTGTNSKSEYVFIYDVKREKISTFEKITMIKEDGDIKIVGYDVNNH